MDQVHMSEPLEQHFELWWVHGATKMQSLDGPRQAMIGSSVSPRN